MFNSLFYNDKFFVEVVAKSIGGSNEMLLGELLRILSTPLPNRCSDDFFFHHKNCIFSKRSLLFLQHMHKNFVYVVVRIESLKYKRICIHDDDICCGW